MMPFIDTELQRVRSKSVRVALYPRFKIPSFSAVITKFLTDVNRSLDLRTLLDLREQEASCLCEQLAARHASILRSLTRLLSNIIQLLPLSLRVSFRLRTVAAVLWERIHFLHGVRVWRLVRDEPGPRRIDHRPPLSSYWLHMSACRDYRTEAQTGKPLSSMIFRRSIYACCVLNRHLHGRLSSFASLGFRGHYCLLLSAACRPHWSEIKLSQRENISVIPNYSSLIYLYFIFTVTKYSINSLFHLRFIFCLFDVFTESKQCRWVK